MRAIGGASRIKGVGILMLLAAMTLSACGDQKKKTNKVLATVDGNEITALQLDAELQHVNGATEENSVQKKTLRKQALDALINRQILLKEAVRNKIDRDPKLIQIVERFKTQAIVQAYLESKEGNLSKPSKSEIDAYFEEHPELFAHRQILDVEQLIIAAHDFDGPLRSEMDSATSLSQMTTWLKKKRVGYARTQHTYTSADLPAEIVGQIRKLGKNHLFVLEDGQQDLLCALTELRESPISREVATAQIERYLLNKKIQEVATAEIARLRSLAKLEYIDKSENLIVEDASPSAQNRSGRHELAEIK
ncbi:peptidyl-prolyl cis-trans isomerase, EpsD family [Collimonas arenae]|uniref:Peptidyl-prolyl cis-trans isomerase, EpsD family n=1 Tax=Collimonas arenae TaxID=279058 RepID=A0A127PSP4_9BURK|nr:EpsD family peptidyl-prolyl cis-trans isomerase [Collimonas arenae]AMP00803.1 peptidyl-prolyl cis-trans isomerase, EpsD family [Collimonas arenae]AMP10696.1 peptidyl-prolyl cis-trans isomerase, EpsD family [Collimonas arenae]